MEIIKAFILLLLIRKMAKLRLLEYLILASHRKNWLNLSNKIRCRKGTWLLRRAEKSAQIIYLCRCSYGLTIWGHKKYLTFSIGKVLRLSAAWAKAGLLPMKNEP